MFLGVRLRFIYIYISYIYEIKIFAYVFALPSTNVSPSLKTYKKRVLRFECIKRDCIYIMTHGSCTTLKRNMRANKRFFKGNMFLIQVPTNTGLKIDSVRVILIPLSFYRILSYSLLLPT